MSRRKRLRPVAAVLAALFAAVLVRAFVELPRYGESRGPAEKRFAIDAVRARHVTNLDAFVNFDFRGFDTLGEEYIFLVAIAGFSLLLQERRGERPTDDERPPHAARRPVQASPAIRLACIAFVPVAIAYGLYVCIHGQLTPGGGFQGGVVVAAAALATFLGFGFGPYRRAVPKSAVESIEALGTLGYVLVGAAAFASATGFLTNVIPIGETGSLLSGGTIDLLNAVVGAAIAGGFLVLFIEFLKETLAPAAADEKRGDG